MLFSYLCTVGEALHRTAYPKGAQSKDADVNKWVTLFSGSPAVCQRQHDGAHRWRPDPEAEEERVLRGYAVLQWDRAGFDPGLPKPGVGDTFDSRWGPAIVVARTDEATTGSYLLLRLFPHGHHGKKAELGDARSDVPKELAGKV